MKRPLERPAEEARGWWVGVLGRTEVLVAPRYKVRSGNWIPPNHCGAED